LPSFTNCAEAEVLKSTEWIYSMDLSDICVYSFTTEIKIDEDYLMTWLQIVLGMVATVIIAFGIVVGAIYTRLVVTEAKHVFTFSYSEMCSFRIVCIRITQELGTIPTHYYTC
jgi:hypothetical protein